MVRVLVPGGATGLGEKPAVVPAGWPLAARVTGLAKPPVEPTLTVYWAASPAQIWVLPGVAERLKSATSWHDCTETSSMSHPCWPTDESVPMRNRNWAVWPA